MLDKSAIFSIDICAYVVMCNHYHLVLKIYVSAQKALSPFEVIPGWIQSFCGNPVAVKFLKGDSLSKGERMLVDSLISDWPERLGSIFALLLSKSEMSQ